LKAIVDAAEFQGGSCCDRTPRRVAQAKTMIRFNPPGEIAPPLAPNACQNNKKIRYCNTAALRLENQKTKGKIQDLKGKG